MSGDGDSGEINEDVAPLDREVYRLEGSHIDRTRRWLAYGLLILLGIIVLGGVLGWLLGKSTHEMESYGIFAFPFVTLAGAMLGFYYSTLTGD